MTKSMTRLVLEKGFTLVEMAVVLTIVGLLIAGILKGRELLDNSRISTMVMQVKGIDAAMKNFQQTYGSLPGDITTASTRLPDCSTAPCNVNGDGDGLIGANQTGYTVATGATTENRTFWVHLVHSRLLNWGVDANYTGTPNKYGTDFPPDPIRGGYLVYYNNWTGYQGKNLMKTQYQVGDGTSYGALPSTALAKLDAKMDDGLPSSGNVQSVNPQAGGACYVSASNQIYTVTNNLVTCDMVYLFQ